MLFNSIEFAIFLPIVFVLYWWVFARNLKLQNLFVVVVSYVFYGWWDWRFLLLIAFTSLCSWGSGLLIDKYKNEQAKAKFISVLNVVLNLLILGIFKYYDFFVSSFADLFLNGKKDGLLLNIILPVGISFYTFQALSYSIDVYRGKMKPVKDIVQFFAFVSFFPQLVAGPIERATNLLPQFGKPRKFDYDMGVDGLRQILWGLFKKMVVADNCAIYVDKVFSDYALQNGSTLVLGIVLFAVQLYCDFSGYSEIAVGTAKLFGIRLMRNFNNPYFATSFADYWKRNHISLTTWFMDYVYYPMIGSSDRLVYWNFCMIVTFLLSGLWHGAGWTFVLWGLYQGVFIVISINSAKGRKRFEKKHGLKGNKPYEWGLRLVTFMIVCVGLILFRAENLSQAWSYFCGIFRNGFFSIPWLDTRHYYIPVVACIAILFVTEWLQRDKEHALDLSNVKSHVVKFGVYYLLIAALFLLGGHAESFIYFQF